jgi:hypothetical protein
MVRGVASPPIRTWRRCGGASLPLVSGTQADAYSGFGALYEPREAGPGLPAIPAITEVACWSHCRRKIFDVWETTKSTVAKAALDQIAQLYAIEDKARFAPPAERLEHRAAVIPLLDGFFAWAQAAERKLSARSELAEACATS